MKRTKQFVAKVKILFYDTICYHMDMHIYRGDIRVRPVPPEVFKQPNIG